jgi:hypothetical protein
LALCGRLDAVDSDLLGWWLCERQVKAGGLNGRPEKLPDVCYSWWVLSSLQILKRTHWYVLRGFQIPTHCFCRPSLTSMAVIKRRYYAHHKRAVLSLSW